MWLALGASASLKILFGAVAFASGVDDLLEAWFGIQDLMHLDVAHGVVLTAFTGILDPICVLIEQNEGRLRRTSESKSE